MSWSFVFLSNVFFSVHSLCGRLLLCLSFSLLFSKCLFILLGFRAFSADSPFENSSSPMCVGWASGFVFFMDFLLSFHLMEEQKMWIPIFQVVDDTQNTNNESLCWTRRTRRISFERYDYQFNLKGDKVAWTSNELSKLCRGRVANFYSKNNELSCISFTYQGNQMAFQNRWRPPQPNVTNVIQDAAWLALLLDEPDSMLCLATANCSAIDCLIWNCIQIWYRPVSMPKYYRLWMLTSASNRYCNRAISFRLFVSFLFRCLCSSAFDSAAMNVAAFVCFVVILVERLHLEPNHFQRCALANCSIVVLSSCNSVCRAAWRLWDKLDLESIDFLWVVYFE